MNKDKIILFRKPLDLFIENNPDTKIKEIIGIGTNSIAFEIYLESSYCFCLLIRKRTICQSGGVKAYKAAANTNAASNIKSHFTTEICGITYDYIITDKLSPISLEKFDNTEKGIKLQKLLVKTLTNLGISQVIHRDEATYGNIMYCNKENKIYFIDFNDTNHDNISTIFYKIPEEIKKNQDKLYNSIFIDYIISIKNIRKHWSNFAKEYLDISKTIIIMSSFNILVNYSINKKLNISSLEKELPIILTNNICKISNNKLDLTSIILIISDFL